VVFPDMTEARDGDFRKRLLDQAGVQRILGAVIIVLKSPEDCIAQRDFQGEESGVEMLAVREGEAISPEVFTSFNGLHAKGHGRGVDLWIMLLFSEELEPEPKL